MQLFEVANCKKRMVKKDHHVTFGTPVAQLSAIKPIKEIIVALRGTPRSSSWEFLDCQGTMADDGPTAVCLLFLTNRYIFASKIT